MSPQHTQIAGVVLAATFVLAGIGLLVYNALPEAKPKVVEVAEAPQVVEPQYPEAVYEVIGASVEGRSIERYTYGDGPRHVVFVGGIHGGYEWNTILLAQKMMDHFKRNPQLIPEELQITIIPSANPDGVFKVMQTENDFTLEQALALDTDESLGRFNAHGVDLNRNFDCKWAPESTWKGNIVSAGTEAFSEPEAKALKNFIHKHQPAAVVFWHSQSNAVYASECENGVIPETLTIMKKYADAAGYNAIASFDAYPVTGDAEGWLASIGIPAITVELETHQTVEWERNLRGVTVLLDYFAN